MAWFLVAVLSLSLLALILCAAAQSPDAADEAQILARSLVAMGDTARLQHVLAKARRGEKVVIGVIGGSITAGASASREDLRWGNRVVQWWRDTFPGVDIGYVNAGIGATGSNIACHRAKADLLVYRPDLVVAEFAVNDANGPLWAETLEGLVRQVLSQPHRPAMMLLFTMNRAGANAQEWHSKVGAHYGLPMVSFRDALWPEIAAGRMRWEDVEADEVHPNDRGHDYCARFVNAVLRQVYDTLPADADLPAIPALAPPLLSDTFQHATFFNAGAIAPLVSEGWTVGEAWPFGPCWDADTAGSKLEFEVEGTAISVCFLRIRRDMGVAQAQVDDRPPVKLQAWFEGTWGGYPAWELVARDLPVGKHRLRITLLEERAELSQGHKFQLQAIMTAGLKG